MSFNQPAAGDTVGDRLGGPACTLRSILALLPGRAAMAAAATARLPVMRPLSDTLRPYLIDLLAAVAGLLGAVATGYSLFGHDVTGDAPWLHALFLCCTALMLLGAVRFLVRSMDFPEPAENAADPLEPAANGRVRPDEAGGAKE